MSVETYGDISDRLRSRLSAAGLGVESVECDYRIDGPVLTVTSTVGLSGRKLRDSARLLADTISEKEVAFMLDHIAAFIIKNETHGEVGA